MEVVMKEKCRMDLDMDRASILARMERLFIRGNGLGVIGKVKDSLILLVELTI
jgi:hypothetical protein